MEFSTKLFIVLVIAASATATSIGLSAPRIFSQESKGVVTNITRCGGYGTPIQLRITECEGRCSFTPGRVYNIEYDMIPSSASTSLSLACDLVFNGTPLRLFEAEIANSSVQPGLMYTVKFSIVPNDILSGQTVKLRAIIYHTDNRLLEICVETECDILDLPL
ncbi:uncharacterized protein LOC110847544 [Folsomia candida]|uniref:Uncharacterized protein n=1 Tax=Folsomia candida TaxID=158441 RepID=A0A226EJZ8_FOLCA|nr:uncharacterized protein LOC110847544 [Folsomia candida]OXA57962.1 hypothetical protein Fcan01_06653 [Folsomia candida]